MDKLIFLSFISRKKEFYFGIKKSHITISLDTVWNVNVGFTQVLDKCIDRKDSYVRDLNDLPVFGLARIAAKRQILEDWYNLTYELYIAAYGNTHIESYCWWGQFGGYYTGNLDKNTLEYYVNVEL